MTSRQRESAVAPGKGSRLAFSYSLVTFFFPHIHIWLNVILTQLNTDNWPDTFMLAANKTFELPKAIPVDFSSIVLAWTS